MYRNNLHLARAAAALFFPILFTSAACGATNTYILDLSTPGSFTLEATSSVGDNDGIVFYWVPLLGNVLNLDHRTPVALNAADSQPIGFSEIRSSDIITPTLHPEVHAAQYIFATNENHIRGFGRESSSFAAKGFATLGSPDPSSDNAWSNPYLIATGTYSGSLVFDTNSLDLVGNVFRLPGDNQPGYPAATIRTVIIPEPATVSHLGFIVLGYCARMRRRVRS